MGGDVVGDAFALEQRGHALGEVGGGTRQREADAGRRADGAVGEEGDPGCAVDPGGDGGEVGFGAGDQRREAAGRLGPAEAVDGVLDAEHGGRVDGLAAEDAVDELAAAGEAEDFWERPGGRVGFQSLDGAGRQREHAVCGLAAEGFCQDQVTTSSLAQGRSMAKAAEVASQMTRPSRSAAMKSAFGMRTPEVVPFQASTRSCAGSMAARSGSAP